MSPATAANFELARDSLQAHEPSAKLTRFRRLGYQRYLHVRSQIDLFTLWEKRWFFITLIVGAILILAPTPSGLTHEGQIVLAMSVMATMLFITEPVPLPTVPLLDRDRRGGAAGCRPDNCRAKPDDQLGAFHHGLADARSGDRQAAARQADRLVDRADDRHEYLLDQFRHHRHVRGDWPPSSASIRWQR